MVNKRLKEIYDQYYLMVMDVAFKVLRDYHLAQDVCQDVFMRSLQTESVRNVLRRR